MHASVEDLIRLRDREPLDAAVAAHLAQCPDCAAELRRLTELRAELLRLPAIEPPAAAWKAIEARIEVPAWSGPRRAMVAAVAVVAMMGALYALHPGSLPQPDPAVAPTLSQQSTGAADRDGVNALVARSQRLEQVLEQMPRRPAVERVSTSATINALQARIQLLDGELSNADNPGASAQDALWRERVRLLNSLVGMRYAEAVRVGYQTADQRGSFR